MDKKEAKKLIKFNQVGKVFNLTDLRPDRTKHAQIFIEGLCDTIARYFNENMSNG
jgi:hypothetical protein